jgi:hypothetical protein
LNPEGIVYSTCVASTIAPKVNILNNGANDQTAITVNYAVAAESYSENVVVPSLAAGANIDVDFLNTLFVLSEGVKNVVVTVNSTCNTGAEVYTLYTSYTVTNPNFGGPIGGYYFANSTFGASCAPDQPVFFWEDTTGSTSLIVDGEDVSGGLRVGTLDDGFFSLGNILGGNFFRYAGVAYDSFFVGTNGMIAFSRAHNNDGQFSTPIPLAIPSVLAPRPAIFPFWKDLNFGDSDVPINRLSYKVDGGKLIITYSRAPIFQAGPTDYVSFQVVLYLQNFLTNGVVDATVVTHLHGGEVGPGFIEKYSNATLSTHTVGQQNESGNAGIMYRRAIPTVIVPGPLFSISSVAIAYGPYNNVLPVELASFTASVNRSDVTLNWSTTSETNNSGFDIERSDVRGQTSNVWSKIGNVNGNGSSSVGHSYDFTDKNLTSGKYSFRLKQIDYNGNFEYFNLGNEVNVGIPARYDLSQNYPNPFNPTTRINYELPLDGKVSIKIFDISGREVATLVNEVKTAGYYSVNFNGLWSARLARPCAWNARKPRGIESCSSESPGRSRLASTVSG